MKWKSIKYKLSLLQEIISPRKCAVCNYVIDDGYFCQRCRDSFRLQKVLYGKDHLQKVILLYKYEKQLQKAIQQIKFNKNSKLLPQLSEEARNALPVNMEYFFGCYDIISSIPTSKERLDARGFDVPEEIFAFVDRKKWRENLLTRTRKTLPLFDLEPALRKEELQGCFKVNSEVTGKNILLCDDIFTTGSTMEEAARTLLLAGARSVSALALCASKDNW